MVDPSRIRMARGGEGAGEFQPRADDDEFPTIEPGAFVLQVCVDALYRVVIRPS